MSDPFDFCDWPTALDLQAASVSLSYAHEAVEVLQDGSQKRHVDGVVMHPWAVELEDRPALGKRLPIMATHQIANRFNLWRRQLVVVLGFPVCH